MRLHLGFEMQYRFLERTPMILTLNVHPSRSRDLVQPDRLTTEPSVYIIVKKNEIKMNVWNGSLSKTST